MEDFEDFLIWRGAFRFQCGLIAVGCGVVGVGLLNFRVMVLDLDFFGGRGRGGVWASGEGVGRTSGRLVSMMYLTVFSV